MKQRGTRAVLAGAETAAVGGAGGLGKRKGEGK